MEKKKPLESCDHIWTQTGYWDGVDEDGNCVNGPITKCTECGGTSYFTWVEYNALPVEKKIELKVTRYDD